MIVLTYKAWRRLFDASPAALGKTLILNDERFTVVGVMPSRFGWWTDDGVWVTLPDDPRDNDRGMAIVRLAQGVSPEAATEQLQAFHQRLAQLLRKAKWGRP